MRRGVPLWRNWTALAQQLAAAHRVVLCSDFDGTLAPIVRHPARARLPAATRRALGRLGRRRRLTVCLVSGRSLAELRRRVGLAGVYYIGSHGWEWAGPDGRRRTRVNTGFAARIQKLGRELQRTLRRQPGIYVERKSVSLAVHYRNASPRVAAQARRLVGRLAKNSAGRLRLLEGKQMVELLPPGAMDKGRAVLALAARLASGNARRPPVIYLGDDVTDESLFRRLRRTDLGIRVGKSEASAARYRLRSPRQVRRFLRRLEEALR